MVFFFIFSCQLVFSGVMALGIPGTGGAGIITAIATFKGGRTGQATGGDYFIGFIALLIALGFAVAALADFFMLTKVRTQLFRIHLRKYCYINYPFKTPVHIRFTVTTALPGPACPRHRPSSPPTC